jgi:hypothetical protein
MRFRYLGDKDEMVAFGYRFAGGNEPEVTDAHALRKLSGNRFFEAVDAGEPAPEPVKNKGGRPRKVKPTEA